jgi:hypothetical protein
VATDRQSPYIQLGQLVAAMPDLNEPLPLSRATQEWLGKVGAVIFASGDRLDIAEFNTRPNHSRRRHRSTTYDPATGAGMKAARLHLVAPGI